MQTIIDKDTLTVIKERKSVRSYSGEKISKGTIEQLLRAAMAAPTAMNMKPWSFIVITEATKLEILARELPFAKMLPKAGTGIVVCAEAGAAALGNEVFAVLDGACASENILLAAEALGLGAVWTAVYPDKQLMNMVRKELGIPDNIIPLNLIPVGIPLGEEVPKQKFDGRNIRWNKW